MLLFGNKILLLFPSLTYLTSNFAVSFPVALLLMKSILYLKVCCDLTLLYSLQQKYVYGNVCTYFITLQSSKC